MRKFIITMNQKGDLEFRLQCISRYKKYITYEKTDKKQVQIVNIDYEGIEKEFKEEIKEHNKQGWNGFLTNPIDEIEHILGIGKNDLYKIRMSLREIKENDIEGYASLNTSYITKETEKAYFIEALDKWIAKSQTIIKNDILYIKRWLLQY